MVWGYREGGLGAEHLQIQCIDNVVHLFRAKAWCNV